MKQRRKIIPPKCYGYFLYVRNILYRLRLANDAFLDCGDPVPSQCPVSCIHKKDKWEKSIDADISNVKLSIISLADCSIPKKRLFGMAVQSMLSINFVKC